MKIPSHKRGLEAPTLAPEPQRKILKKTHGTPISSKALENSSDYSVNYSFIEKGCFLIFKQVIFEVVYTDGSSRGNGKVGARAGVGVFFGDGDPRNISEPLAGSKQTNQRAELTAALKAIRLSNPNKPLEIRTDSQYLIKGVTSWIKGWVKKNWITSTGKEVLNRDLFESLDKEIKRRKLIIKWVLQNIKSFVHCNSDQNSNTLVVFNYYVLIQIFFILCFLIAFVNSYIYYGFRSPSSHHKGAFKD